MTPPAELVWWWVGLTTADNRAMGAIVIAAPRNAVAESGDPTGITYITSKASAILEAAGYDPARIMQSGEPMDPAFGDPPLHCVDIIMSVQRAREVAQQWCGGVADPADVDARILGPITKRRPS